MKYLILVIPLAVVIWLAYGAYQMTASVDQKLGAAIQRALD